MTFFRTSQPRKTEEYTEDDEDEEVPTHALLIFGVLVVDSYSVSVELSNCSMASLTGPDDSQPYVLKKRFRNAGYTSVCLSPASF